MPRDDAGYGGLLDPSNCNWRKNGAATILFPFQLHRSFCVMDISNTFPTKRHTHSFACGGVSPRAKSDIFGERPAANFTRSALDWTTALTTR
jgi:hypothetical protein